MTLKALNWAFSFYILFIKYLLSDEVMKMFLTACCKFKMYNELEPIGLLCHEEYFNRVIEYMVFEGDPRDLSFKPCNNKCQLILGSEEIKEEQ